VSGSTRNHTIEISAVDGRPPPAARRTADLADEEGMTAMTAHEHPWGCAVVATAVGLLLVPGLAGCGDDSDGSGASVAVLSKRSFDTLRTIPERDEQDEEEVAPIEPGRYLVPSSAWSVTDFTVTFPEGWTAQYGHVYGKNRDEADELGFYAVVVDEIYNDSCAPEDETTRAVGPGIDDLDAALRWQAGGATISKAVSTTLGGYPATRIHLRIPKHLDVAGCRLAPYGLQIWYSEPADQYFVLLPGAVATVYVVDVDGERQVFLTQAGDSTSAADRAELQTVLDSIHIAGSTGGPSPSATDEQSLTPTAPAADGSIYFAADTRGGKALTDPVTFNQAEFHPKPSDIYLSRRGTPVRRIIATEGDDRCPRVSPDGEHLAYLQNATLVVARLDAAGNPSAPRVRTHLPASPSGCPQWSPDGSDLGYVAFVDDAPLYTPRPAEVHAVNLDGHDRVVASFEAQTWHEPAFAWSPDGEKVAYTRPRADSGALRSAARPSVCGGQRRVTPRGSCRWPTTVRPRWPGRLAARSHSPSTPPNRTNRTTRTGVEPRAGPSA
jgi:hypothetical protein